MSRLPLIAAVSAAALLGVAGCGKSSTTAANDTTSTTPMSSADASMASTAPDDVQDNIKKAQDFVDAAGQAGLAEIQTSKIALERSNNADVKAFAQQMIDDHTKAGEALKAAAGAAALAPPSDVLDDFHMRRVNDLTEDKPGDPNFDADYMHMQVDAHNDAVKLFKDYADDGKIAQIKSFAAATLPTLEEHQTKAKSVNDMVKSSES